MIAACLTLDGRGPRASFGITGDGRTAQRIRERQPELAEAVDMHLELLELAATNPGTRAAAVARPDDARSSLAIRRKDARLLRSRTSRSTSPTFA